jgi:hypothetical protein
MMTEKQIPRMMGRLVEHQTAFLPLPIPDGQWVSQNPLLAIALCVEAIKNRPKGDAALARAPIGQFFMTVTLGSCKTVNGLAQAIILNRKETTEAAGNILRAIRINEEQVEVDLYTVSGHELGFSRAERRTEIYEHAFAYGFEKCPAEVAPLARIGCNDTQWANFGMDPMSTISNDQIPEIFCLTHNKGTSMLHVAYGDPLIDWGPHYVWIFVWPRRK